MHRKIKAGAGAILAITSVVIMFADEASARGRGGGVYRSGGSHLRASRSAHRPPRLTRPVRTVQRTRPRTPVAKTMPPRANVAPMAQARAQGRGQTFAQMGQPAQPQAAQQPTRPAGATNLPPPRVRIAQGPTIQVLPPRVLSRQERTSMGVAPRVWDPSAPSSACEMARVTKANADVELAEAQAKSSEWAAAKTATARLMDAIEKELNRNHCDARPERQGDGYVALVRVCETLKARHAHLVGAYKEAGIKQMIADKLVISYRDLAQRAANLVFKTCGI